MPRSASWGTVRRMRLGRCCGQEGSGGSPSHAPGHTQTLAEDPGRQVVPEVYPCIRDVCLPRPTRLLGKTSSNKCNKKCSCPL